MSNKKEVENWLSSAFGGLTGQAIKAKQKHKAALEKVAPKPKKKKK